MKTCFLFQFIEAVTFLVSTIYSEMFLCLSVDEKANVILSSNCSTNSSNNKWTIFGNYMLKNVHLGKCLKENSMLLKLLVITFFSNYSSF